MTAKQWDQVFGHLKKPVGFSAENFPLEQEDPGDLAEVVRLQTPLRHRGNIHRWLSPDAAVVELARMGLEPASLWAHGRLVTNARVFGHYGDVVLYPNELLVGVGVASVPVGMNRWTPVYIMNRERVVEVRTHFSHVARNFSAYIVRRKLTA